MLFGLTLLLAHTLELPICIGEFMQTEKQIAQLNRQFEAEIQDIIDNKTKPLGALGQLEQLAMQLALIQSQGCNSPVNRIHVDKAKAIVFAGDHGIAAEGVSIAPSDVTGQMVMNFLNGGAAINCFCRSNDIAFDVIDCGILRPVEGQYANLFDQRLGSGTNNFVTQPAMTLAQAKKGLEFGELLVEKYVSQGSHVLLLGEMGIANTSSASAIMAALTEVPLEQCVGKGTGITLEQLAIKVSLIRQALDRFDARDPLTVLTELGGFEIVQMVGVILAAAQAKIAVVIDGFIVSAAALVAYRMNKNVADYLIFSHVSQESGHKLLLNEIHSFACSSMYECFIKKCIHVSGIERHYHT